MAFGAGPALLAAPPALRASHVKAHGARPAAWSCPCLRKSAQVTAGPGVVPVPWQVLQASSRATVIRTCAPRMASQKPKCIRYSMSEPFSGSSLAASRSPREKIWEKMSRKPPPNPPARRPASPPASSMLEKSKPEKSTPGGGECAGAGRTGTVTAGRKVVRIESVLVVNLALFLVAQDFVGFRELLEFLFRAFVPGIDVRVMLARQMAVGLADLLRLGVAADAEGP